MKHLFIFLVRPNAPFRDHGWVVYDFSPSSLGVFLLLRVLLPFRLEIVDIGREVGFERPVMDDFFECSREVQGLGVEDSLLSLAEEVLDSYVHDV